MGFVRFDVGDTGGDGHGLVRTYIFNSNLSREDVVKAYNAGVKKTKVDITKYCKDYEDSSIDDDVAKKLTKAGVDLGRKFTKECPLEDYDESPEELFESEGRVGFYTASFLSVYLQIAKIGNPKFKFQMIEMEAINVGGYGLLSN